MYIPIQLTDKQKAELAFWDKEILHYVEWMEGTLPQLYNTPSPLSSEKESSRTIEHAAILTWLKLHQRPKYLADLQFVGRCIQGIECA